MANKDIRMRAMLAGVPLWKVAEAYGVSETTFTRMLRHELPELVKQRLFLCIDDLAKEGAQSHE